MGVRQTASRVTFQDLRKRFLADESGQTLVLAALCLSVFLGALALSVDAGVLRYQRRLLQNAADAAALAGALELRAYGATANCSALQTAAQDALTENGFTGSTLLTNCAARNGTSFQITVNNGPCALAGDPNSGNTSYVEVVVSRPVATVFAKVFGVSSVPMLARAEAFQPVNTCVYALDPSGSNAAVLDSQTSVTASCGFMVESTSNSAVQCTSASLTATTVAIVGSGSESSCAANATINVGVSLPSPADPLSSLTKPTVPACGTTTKGTVLHGSSAALSITGPVTLYPDRAFCGGITISRGATVTLEPGTYVLGSSNSAGGLSIDVGATVTGTGVTFYNYGTSGAIAFTYSSFTSGGVDLVAPTSGTYGGILFFQDPRNTSEATLLGASNWNTVLQGAYYFPTAKVLDTYSGTAAYNILVADDIEFGYASGPAVGASSFASDYSSLANGSPLPGSGSVLVQ